MALILWADRCLGKAPYWLILSNSGDFLRLLILNNVWKYISGWINYPGKVISQKTCENNGEYRGSKSNLDCLTNASKNESMFVKEQRVDDSRFLFIKANPIKIKRSLRCTLMGLERGCRNINNSGLFSKIIESSQVKIPTKVLFSKNYSTLSINNLDPWFLTGFSDAEGSFIISVYKDNNNKLKWR